MTAYTRTEEFAAGLTGQDICRKIRKECEADIIIGIPTCNNARTIGHVLLTVQAGLACSFPELKAVIVTADAGSTDGTMAITRNHVIRKIPVYTSRCTRDPFAAHDLSKPSTGRADALRVIFATAAQLDARACAVLDADVSSITPGWIERLVRPVLKNGFDHVSPQYTAQTSSSLLTNTVLYPLMRALYGKRVRQPLGANFCLSGRLVRFHLEQMAAEAYPAHFGADMRLLGRAMANDFRIAEAFLGPRIRDRAGTPRLNGLLPDIMGAAFDFIESDHHLWKNVRGSSPVPLFGSASPAVAPDAVNVQHMLEVFRQGVRDLKLVWAGIMSAADVSLLEYLAFRPEGRFHITPTFWSRIVYDFAAAYREKKLVPSHLLNSFTPLYLGNAASHLLEVVDKGQQEAEDEIERLCRAFEDSKDQLVRSWRA